MKSATSKYRFARTHNLDAKDFLEQVTAILKDSSHSHNLFFIDPYDYTRYSQENLNVLLKLNRSDYLIFMPTNHIYRFHNTKDNPARKFIFDFGINQDILKDIKNINYFANQLTIILKDKADTKYGYNYKIENKDSNNSVFHLFFITKKFRRAENFLEGIDKIKEMLKTSQVVFFNFSRWDVKSILEKSLSQEKTNQILFDEMIQKGYLAKKFNLVLKHLEKSEQLVVRADFKRRQGAFYLDKKDKTIYIKYQNERYRMDRIHLEPSHRMHQSIRWL